MFSLILYEPEIPPNAGNIIRLCANVGASLHLIRPLGFAMDERRLRRAGLDYRELASVHEHEDLDGCLGRIGASRVFALSTKGHKLVHEQQFAANDAFLMGPETRGLPAEVLESMPRSAILRLPMRPGNRSLNIANAAAIVLYEAWRQLAFSGGS